MNRNTRGTDPSTLLRMTCAVLETARRKDNFADHCENLERVHHETIPADKRESSASEYRPAGASRETRSRPAPIHWEGAEGSGRPALRGCGNPPARRYLKYTYLGLEEK